MNALSKNIKTPSDISCLKATELFCDSRDRPLNMDEKNALNNHIDDCSSCQVAAGQFTKLFEQLKQLIQGK